DTQQVLQHQGSLFQWHSSRTRRRAFAPARSRNMKSCMNSPLRRMPQHGGIIFRFLFFIFVIYLARRPLLGFAGSFWIVNDKPAASDAIVILGDDNYGGDRATRAAQLFKDGMAPRVVASGRYLRPYASIAELEQHDLTDRSVPASAIVRFDQH